jgi:metallo-beta-lactamase family protein
MKVAFYGGAQSVTGANYIVEAGGKRIMIDCGLAQGCTECDAANRELFPYEVGDIDAVFITHAHIDHTGRLPLLVKRGYRGPIYSTPPTRDAAHALLEDGERLMREDALRDGLDPLYAPDDVAAVMRLWESVPYYQGAAVGDAVVMLYNAGHILGSSSIFIKDEHGIRAVFSGDLGNSPAPLLGNKDSMPEAEYCIIESAYGNRLHEDRAVRKELLEDAIEETAKRGGVLMVPAFAMERTQELLSELDELVEHGRIPHVPVYLDSPLATRLTDVYRRYRDYLGNREFDFNFKGLHITETSADSRAINGVPPPKVIIAGAGMSNGGRILHHERRYLPDPASTLLIIGYQSEGSLGRRIVDGAREVVIFGERVPVRCRVIVIGGYSAHADQAQLLEWLKPERDRLKRVFVVQGEGEASDALAVKIRDELAVDAVVPRAGQSFELA